MRDLKKTACLGLSFLFFLISCSSHKKQFYYFDHSRSDSEKTEVVNIEIDEADTTAEQELNTPNLYASSEASPVVLKRVQPKEKPPVVTKSDSMSSQKDPGQKKKEEMRTVFAVSGIVFGIAGIIVSVFSWPVAIGLGVLGITSSILGLRRKSKFLAIIGLLISLIALGVAIFVAYNPLFQAGNDGFGSGSIINI